MNDLERQWLRVPNRKEMTEKIVFPYAGENILVIDPSSEHLAYCVCHPKDEIFTISESGMIWVPSGRSLGNKLSYIYQSLEYLVLNNNIKHIVTEAFFAPPFRQAGTSVIPTINNNLLMLTYDLEKGTGTKISVRVIGSGEWRKHLGSGSVKYVDKHGKTKRDFKAPCRDKVITHLGNVLPETLTSNVNLKQKTLPNDITDVLGMAIGIAIEARYPKIVASPDIFKNTKTVSVLNSLI